MLVKELSECTNVAKCKKRVQVSQQQKKVAAGFNKQDSKKTYAAITGGALNLIQPSTVIMDSCALAGSNCR